MKRLRQVTEPAAGLRGVSVMKCDSCFQRCVAKTSLTFLHVSVEQEQTADLIKICPSTQCVTAINKV